MKENQQYKTVKEYCKGQYTSAISEIRSEQYTTSSKYQLVTIHGMLESREIWEPLFSQLAGQFRQGFAMSLPWSGDKGSLWGTLHTPSEWIEPLWRSLPSQPTVVLAHSFGANSFLSLLNQSKIKPMPKKMVLISPYYKASYDMFDWSLFQDHVNRFEDFIDSSIRIRPGNQTLSRDSLKLIREKVKEICGCIGWMQFFQLYSQTPGLDLKKLSFPTLVIGGDNDFSIPSNDLHDITERLPKAVLNIQKNCGHFAMLENTEAVSNRFIEFLN